MACVLVIAGSAHAFGTIGSMGQNREHERITRRALDCAKGPACLQPGTLNELAGVAGKFGAVGYPDGSTLVLSAKAHCDNGDHSTAPGYPRTLDQANGALLECRAWMVRHMDEAVEDAARLLDAQGRVRGDQVTLDCSFAGNMKGRAKCNVLQDMGIVLHASQDFYAHSNWVDLAQAPFAAGNPPGMGQAGPAPFISLRGTPSAPPQLITGCFDIPEGKCGVRIRHADLNKDNGPISAVIGLGTTPRGSVNGNFARAVEAATLDTRDKWTLLGERLKVRYGQERGARMVCALGADDPVKAC